MVTAVAEALGVFGPRRRRSWNTCPPESDNIGIMGMVNFLNRLDRFSADMKAVSSAWPRRIRTCSVIPRAGS